MLYVVCAAFSEADTAKIPGIKTTIVPGGAHASPLRIQAGEADMGMIFTVNIKYAAYGLDPYKNLA